MGSDARSFYVAVRLLLERGRRERGIDIEEQIVVRHLAHRIDGYLVSLQSGDDSFTVPQIELG